MTNEFLGHIARRVCHIAALEHENHKNNYALRVLPCSATNSTHYLHLTRIFHELRVPSLVCWSHKEFSLVARHHGYATPSENPFWKQHAARSSREFMKYPGWKPIRHGYSYPSMLWYNDMEQARRNHGIAYCWAETCSTVILSNIDI